MKQATLNFASAKRTVSGSNVGKAKVSSSKPLKTPRKVSIDKTSSDEEDVDSYDDINLVSDEEEEEEGESPAVNEAAPVKPTEATDKKESISPEVRTPTARTASKKGAAKKITRAQEDSSSTTETAANSGVFRASNVRPEDLAKKAEGNASKNDSSKRPELKPKDPKWRKIYAEVQEKMGHMPAIHGERQNRIHEILRVFDNSYEYGPCIGMTRLERWERAEKLGLKPPKEIYEILNTKQGATLPEYSECVFYGEV